MTDPSVVNNSDIIRVKLGTGSQYGNTYSVKLTIGGVSDLFKVTTVSLADGISELNQQNSLTLYPNPTTGLINITGKLDAGNIEIYNVAGQKVMSEEIQNSLNHQLNLSGFNPGMYLLKYYTKTKVYHAQFVLKSN